LNLSIDRLLDFFLILKSGEFVKKLYLKKKNTNLRNLFNLAGIVVQTEKIQIYKKYFPAPQKGINP